MKITKQLLRRLIKEEIATVTDDAIEDVVMSVLSDEGGAAGAEPIEDALEDLEDDEISLPDEDIEDIIGDVTGVKRHADGDYIDTTQLESRRMKITKRQLRRIIKEEKSKLVSEMMSPYANEAEAIIAEGQAFFDKVIQLSQDSEDDPAAQTALEQIVAALSDDVEKRSYGYVKFKVTL